jgi:hypothetical protein
MCRLMSTAADPQEETHIVGRPEAGPVTGGWTHRGSVALATVPVPVDIACPAASPLIQADPARPMPAGEDAEFDACHTSAPLSTTPTAIGGAFMSARLPERGSIVLLPVVARHASARFRSHDAGHWPPFPYAIVIAKMRNYLKPVFAGVSRGGCEGWVSAVFAAAERAGLAWQALQAARDADDAHALLLAEAEWEDDRRLAQAYGIAIGQGGPGPQGEAGA